MKKYEYDHSSYIDFWVSYIHLKDVTIIQNMFLSVDPNKVTIRLTEMWLSTR